MADITVPGSTVRPPAAPTRRRLPIGAEPVEGGTSFRVWAPARETVSVIVEGHGEHALAAEASGHFSGLVPGAGPGDRYLFRIPGMDALCPDPASRYQPGDREGWSVIVDLGTFRWRDGGWTGLELDGQVLCEIHIGTLTEEGTWAAAAARLPHFRDLGVTAIELMPVADHPGRFGWGYDGVALFAPNHNYGSPDDFRRFVDAAHEAGIGVILDVVYNHFGPKGGCHGRFSKTWWNRDLDSEWGAPLNFDRQGSDGVREFVLANVRCLVEEYHLDGLRIDATQALQDSSEPPIITEIVQVCRDAAGARNVLVIGENEPQRAELMRARRDGGFGLDALWNDDFHHSALVAVTGRREAYYTDYEGSPQELVSAARHGYLFQGQFYAWQGKRRGTLAFGIPIRRFVNYLENHDQIANLGHGRRLHQLTSPGRARAITALLLLAPGTPLLFQGQDFWSTKPFLYFVDFDGELGESVRAGRLDFVKQFASLAAADSQGTLPDPTDRATFERCRLDWREAEQNREAVALHRDLIRLRRADPVLSPSDTALDGAVLGPEAFALRFFGSADDRLLLVNLGPELSRRSIGEPLMAPPADREWRLAWSSENPLYGGSGTPPVETTEGWRLPAHSAILMRPDHEPS